MGKILVYESFKGGKSFLQALPPMEFTEDKYEQQMKLVQIYTDIEEQTIDGFGGAFTQAAAQTYFQMGHEKRQEILTLLFGKEGMSYNSGRIPIGACDFSDGNYSYCDKKEENLKSFSLEKDLSDLIPFVKEALAINPEIKLLASPWSPPAWMKTNGDMCNGGKLKKEYYSVWAEYLVRYIKACSDQNIFIKYLTIQNEPKAVQTWESCIYSAKEEQEFITDYLKPLLIRNGLDDVKIVIWDHNKENMFLRAREILSRKDTDSAVDGIAFHWYSGDHFENVELCRRYFPQKELLFTEGCVELRATNTTMADKARTAGRTEDAAEAPWEFGEFYAHDIFGNLNHGMNRFIDWNMILNKEGGPNHVKNYCSAPLICDSSSQHIYLQPSYIFISHFSRFLPYGTKKIAVSRYDSELEAMAGKTPEGKTVLVMMNPSEKSKPVIISNVCKKEILPFEMKPHSIISAVF